MEREVPVLSDQRWGRVEAQRAGVLGCLRTQWAREAETTPPRGEWGEAGTQRAGTAGRPGVRPARQFPFF